MGKYDESKHPRGNPGNKGQFAKKTTGIAAPQAQASVAPTVEEDSLTSRMTAHEINAAYERFRVLELAEERRPEVEQMLREEREQRQTARAEEQERDRINAQDAIARVGALYDAIPAEERPVLSEQDVRSLHALHSAARTGLLLYGWRSTRTYAAATGQPGRTVPPGRGRKCMRRVWLNSAKPQQTGNQRPGPTDRPDTSFVLPAIPEEQLSLPHSR